MYRTRVFCVVGVTLVSFSVSCSVAHAASRPATNDDLEWMKWAGLPPELVQAGTNVDPDNPNIGKEMGEIKKWLAERATKNSKIRCLNPDFARKLKTFMEATQAATGKMPIITDGYRSMAQQQSIINRGDGSTRVSTPCGSYHPWGLAADFNQVDGATENWMRSNYRNFGFSHLGWDRNHYQDARGKVGQCGQCTADGPDGVMPPSSASPSAGFANALRQAFGMQPQPVAQPPLPPQPYTQTQPIFDSFKDPIINPTTTEPTSGSPPQPNVSDRFTFPDETASSGKLVADRLAELAGFETATSTQTATSVPLTIDGKDVSGLKSERVMQTSDVSKIQPQTGTSPIQQTFITDDLSWRGGKSFDQTPQTQMQQLLAAIRRTLLAMLAALRPFGGGTHEYVSPLDVPYE